MLPQFQKIEANADHSFYVEHMKFHHFPNPLLFHPDIEILLEDHSQLQLNSNMCFKIADGNISIILIRFFSDPLHPIYLP